MVRQRSVLFDFTRRTLSCMALLEGLEADEEGLSLEEASYFVRQANEESVLVNWFVRQAIGET